MCFSYTNLKKLARDKRSVVKSQFGLAKSSLFTNACDMTVPQPNFGPSFIVESLTISDEIHCVYRDIFFQSIA
jgi:hypothetical protein